MTRTLPSGSGMGDVLRDFADCVARLPDPFRRPGEFPIASRRLTSFRISLDTAISIWSSLAISGRRFRTPPKARR